MAENLWGKVVTTSDLEPIESSLGSINTKVDNLDTKLDTSNSKIENVKTSIGLNTDAENTNSIFGKLNGIRNQWTTFWNTWTSARAAKLDNLDGKISSRAPSNTALSTATWTNARAAKLDNLDALISSRAPASTALSTAQWTNTRAGYLDAAISSRASQASLNSLQVSVNQGFNSKVHYSANTTSFVSADKLNSKTMFDSSSLYMTNSGRGIVWVSSSSSALAYDVIVKYSVPSIGTDIINFNFISFVDYGGNGIFTSYPIEFSGSEKFTIIGTPAPDVGGAGGNNIPSQRVVDITVKCYYYK